MVSQDISWVNLDLGEYKIDLKLGGGMFSSVYRGVHIKTGERKAFKVAKPQDLVSSLERGDRLGTRAIARITGSTMDVLPEADKLLSMQHARLSEANKPGWIKVDGIVEQPAVTYYEMDLIEGDTLRQVMMRKPITVDDTIEIVRCLGKSSPDGSMPYHGDIKPENILVTKSGITIIDPGYFGRLELGNGSTVPNCAVTTVAYYPTLEPDDLLAFGLMLFEMVLGVLPTAESADSEEFDLTRIGSNLLEMVRTQEMAGKYFLSGILNVPLPSTLQPQISPDVEKLLLKCIGLSLTPSGKLDLDSGFRSFGAIGGALETLRAKGIEQFVS